MDKEVNGLLRATIGHVCNNSKNMICTMLNERRDRMCDDLYNAKRKEGHLYNAKRKEGQDV